MASTRRPSTKRPSKSAPRRAKRSGIVGRAANRTSEHSPSERPNPAPAVDWAERHEANRLALLEASKPRREARARSEADMIAQALAALPQESRESIGEDEHPANHLASALGTQAVIHKIMRRRLPRNQWLRVHDALAAMDETDGYNIFLDCLRDVAFLVGLDYGRQALPAWWGDYEALDAETQAAVGVVVSYAAEKVRGEE